MNPLPTWPCNYPVSNQRIDTFSQKPITDFDKLLASIFKIPLSQPTLFDLDDYLSDITNSI